MKKGRKGYTVIRGASDSVRSILWPITFSTRVRPVIYLCRWAARRGTQVHPALFLSWSEKHGNHVRVSRPISAGTALMSVPLAICATTSREDRLVNSTGTTTPLEQMCHFFSRSISDVRSPWAPYVQFLHDSYNEEAGDGEIDAVDGSGEHVDESFRADLDRLLLGNAIRVHGVPNAPYLTRNDVTSPRSRAEWVRHKRLLRQVEQSLPHFACSLAAWSLSMALSRTFSDSEGELSVFPLLDMCNHSSNPSAHFVVATAERLLLRKSSSSSDGIAPLGVQGCRSHEPHVHLYSVRDIPAGESVSVLYDERGVDTAEEAELWRLRYGFVPKCGAVVSRKTLDTRLSSALSLSL